MAIHTHTHTHTDTHTHTHTDTHTHTHPLTHTHTHTPTHMQIKRTYGSTAYTFSGISNKLSLLSEAPWLWPWP